MRPAVVSLIVVYLLIGLFLSLFGAFRYPVLEWADGKHRRDLIGTVRLAHVGVDGELYVCVFGTYGDGQQEYWIRVPVMRMAGDPDRLEAESGYVYIDYLTKWRLPRANATPGNCGESPVDPARSVEVRRLKRDRIEGMSLHLDLSAELARASVDELVFELRSDRDGPEPVAALAYGNKALEFSGRNVFQVVTDSYFVPGSKAWLLLLPFAWALDVVLWPYVLFMWMSYAGAH